MLKVFSYVLFPYQNLDIHNLDPNLPNSLDLLGFQKYLSIQQKCIYWHILNLIFPL